MDDPFRYYGADWLGFALTFLSLHLLGSQHRAGFLLGAVASVAWCGFAVMTDSLAVLVANLVFLVMNGRGWLRWGRQPTAGDAGSTGV